MLQIAAAGAYAVADLPKSISAQKPKREGGHSRAKKKRGGENTRWKRLMDAVEKGAASPSLIEPLPRLVYWGHLTRSQGAAGMKYAEVMRRYERYHLGGKGRIARSQSFEPAIGGEDQEIQRHVHNGTMDDYLREAKKAKRDYAKLGRVMARFADPVTGRNVAKDVVDDLCVAKKEPPAQWRANVAAVLSAIAKEFDEPKSSMNDEERQKR